MRKLIKKTFRLQKRQRESAPDVTKSDRSERWGLLLLYDATLTDASVENPFQVDIVAVHGLNGDPYKTWTHENGTMWLKDLLPTSIPGSRIFTYGYPSHLFFNRSKAGIREYAEGLLSYLSGVRDEDVSKAGLKYRDPDVKILQEEKRPIIFVCHSLGGIVFKQALILAHEDDHYQEILTGTSAVLFLGTPHRGSSGTHMARLVGNIINVCLHASRSHGLAGETKTHLLEALSANSTVLKDIARSFRNRAGALSIVTCYETENTPPIGQLVVDKWSAIMDVPNEESIPIYANHIDMCRFVSETSSNYLLVSKALKRLARRAHERQTATTRSLSSLSEAEKTCIILLNTCDVADYKSVLPRRVDGTCQWVLENKQYLYWLSETNATLLWVTGYPGCGKTILSSYIIDYLKQSMDSRTIVCCFFCDEKIETQRDGTAILRSVIHQILACRHDLIRHAKAAFDIQGSGLIGNFNTLWNIFHAIATDARSGPINVVVDAIDECEEETRNRLLDRVTGLICSVRSMETPVPHAIKFLITSRPYPVIARRLNGYTDNHLQIEEIQAEVSNDVRLVIQQKVKEIVQGSHCKPSTQDFLEQSLFARADQTFLWVTVILQHLERSLLASEKDFQGILNALPQDLEALYEQFLRSIPPQSKEIAIKLLHIIVGSSRPLTLDEINIVMTIQDGHRTVSAVEAECQPYMRRTIEGILGPLVRISESKVYLVHQSVKEFLCDLSIRTNNALSATYGINSQNASFVLARSCILYLSLDDFAGDQLSADQASVEEISPVSLAVDVQDTDTPNDFFSLEDNFIFKDMFKEESVINAEACKSLAMRHKFFDYSATHWGNHFSSSENIAPQKLQEAAICLSGQGTHRLSNWLSYFWTNIEIGLPYPTNFDPLIVASFFGQSTILQSMLQRESHIPEIAACALYWASRMGHRDIVETLLGTDVEPDFRVMVGQSPLITSAQLGHLGVVDLLIRDDRVDVNSTGDGGRTPLSFASGNGHLEVVKLLLNHKDIEADVRDVYHGTALFWAVFGNHLPVVRLLAADERVNINRAGRVGQTAFSCAAADGMVDLVKFFLADYRLMPELKDNRGRTAISLAAGNGHLEVTKLLVRTKRIDVSCKDQDGRNAISWACSGGHNNVLKVLIRADPLGIDEPDDNGWTPLSWAMLHGSLDIVNTLIATGLVDVNRKDNSGRSPVSWAAGCGFLKILKAFMAVEGVDLETKDVGGRTPLEWAKINGFQDVERLLTVP